MLMLRPPKEWHSQGVDLNLQNLTLKIIDFDSSDLKPRFPEVLKIIELQNYSSTAVCYGSISSRLVNSLLLKNKEEKLIPDPPS